MVSCHVTQTGFELLASSDLPGSASRVAEMPNMYYHTQLLPLLFNIVLKSPRQKRQTRQRNKQHINGKAEVKLLLFAVEVILYIHNLAKHDST